MDEFEIVQNRTLGAHVLSVFIEEYFKKNQEDGLELNWIFPIIPIVFNERTRKTIYNRTYSRSGLINSINEDRSIFSGVQEMMEGMFDTTMTSLGIALTFGNIYIDRENGQLHKGPNTIKMKLDNPEYKEIIQASKRLGAWFSSLKKEEIVYYFNLKF